MFFFNFFFCFFRWGVGWHGVLVLYKNAEGVVHVQYHDHVAEEGQEDTHFAATSVYLCLEELTASFPQLTEFYVFAGLQLSRHITIIMYIIVIMSL